MIDRIVSFGSWKRSCSRFTYVDKETEAPNCLIDLLLAELTTKRLILAHKWMEFIIQFNYFLYILEKLNSNKSFFNQF